MRSLTLRFVVALLTFSVGVAVASVWLVSRVDPETPPCRSCAEIYASAAHEIPTVTLCEVVSNPEHYRDQIVRLDVSFRSDSGSVSISDDAGNCAKDAYTYAGFADPHASCVETQKALSVYSGYRTWYDAPPVEVVIVGRFGIIDDRNFYGGREGFNILCLEQVKPDGTGLLERIYYTLGRAVNFVVPA